MRTNDFRRAPSGTSAARLAALLVAGLASTSGLAQHDVATQSAPSDPAAEAALLTNTRQLTFEGRRSGEGYFSRDGRKMVFQSEREADNPFYQIYLLDLESGDTQRISPGHGKTTCAWISPSGGQVLFASTHDDPAARDRQKEEFELRAGGKERRYAWDYDENFELYLHDLKTGQNVRLTNARGYDAEGCISPDGRSIVFSSNRHAYWAPLPPEDAARFEHDPSLMLDLYQMDLLTRATKRLTTARGYDGGPFYSHDGSQICWRRFSEDGATAEVFVAGADGSNERQLTRLGAMSWAPFFHPSGEYLVFTTNKHGFANFELYLVRADGEGEPVRVTHTDGFDGLPVFSPDGRQLAWTTNRTAGKQSQIFIADWNDEAARKMLALNSAPAAAEQSGAHRSAEARPAAPHEIVQLPQTSPEIVAADIRAHVERLAGEDFEGRLTGTPGEQLATQYVADFFNRIRLEPAGDNATYFQEFSFTAGADIGPANVLSATDAAGKPLADAQAWKVDADWRPLAWSRTGEIAAADVVFAGYGLVVPAEQGVEEYDSFVHLDVAGKWVLVFRYLPEGVTPERRQQLAPFSGLRYKATVLRGKGALGMLVVSGPNSGVKEQLIALGFDASLSETGLAAASITDAAAEALLRAGGAKKSLKELQDEFDKGEPAMGFALAGVKIGGKIDVTRVQHTGRNVLGRLRSGAPQGTPAVLIGAHIDHLGKAGGANSLARDEEKGAIHYGADDNASGSSGMLEIAELLADLQRRGELKLKRDVIFGSWSGEELGLLGVNHYVNSIGAALGSPNDIRGAIGAALNMDMIGRLDKTLILQGVGSSSAWAGEIERRNAPIGLNISPQKECYLPTDATSFYMKGVPILNAFTGSHPEYHTPRDKPETLNYDGAAKVAKFMGLVLRSLATADALPDFQQVQMEPQGPRARMRAFLGTIPDYATGDLKGVKLSGVSKGGPAEAAGVQGGDVIVELAGKAIENIYDYTYALEAMKPGQEAEIVVDRGGQKLKLKIVPGSRE